MAIATGLAVAKIQPGGQKSVPTGSAPRLEMVRARCDVPANPRAETQACHPMNRFGVRAVAEEILVAVASPTNNPRPLSPSRRGSSIRR